MRLLNIDFYIQYSYHGDWTHSSAYVTLHLHYSYQSDWTHSSKCISIVTMVTQPVVVTCIHSKLWIYNEFVFIYCFHMNISSNLWLPLFYLAPSIYYIPVIRTPDNSSPPSLGSPCAMNLSDDNTDMQVVAVDDDITGSPIIGQAFAGPLSPAQVIYK